MFKITFIGAGSTVFAKNVLGDCILTKEIGEYEIWLYDIDEKRLNESKQMLDNINKKYEGSAQIHATLDRVEALRDAKYIFNCIQVGGYEPCTVTDFEIPKKYNLRQTIGDTLGIGGIFRSLRTIPVLESIAVDVHKYAHKDALFINYSNPMAILTGYMARYLDLNVVGLCHSVQVCAPMLLMNFKMLEYAKTCKWEIAGINHQAWLLKIEDKDGNDLYPEIKRRNNDPNGKYMKKMDLVRLDMMNRFGYYITESSEHTSEYTPYYIKSRYPELIEKYNIPLDEYPRRCVRQIEDWNRMREKLLSTDLTHSVSQEYGAKIIKSMELNEPYRLHGNVINNNLITNLPREACVEVPCLVDSNGISPCVVGDLPIQCAALNRTNINVQLMTIEAARTRKKDAVYQAAYLDPHTAAELSMDDIKSLCDDLFEAHGDWIPKYE